METSQVTITGRRRKIHVESEFLFPKQTRIEIHDKDGHVYSCEQTDYDQDKWTVYYDGQRAGEIGKRSRSDVLWFIVQTLIKEAPVDS